MQFTSNQISIIKCALDTAAAKYKEFEGMFWSTPGMGRVAKQFGHQAKEATALRELIEDAEEKGEL